MTEILVDKLQTYILIDKLKHVFNPYVISDNDETVLNFNNEIGEGTFRIINVDGDILNLTFKGKLSQNLDIKFFNSKSRVFNFIYLQSGKMNIYHDGTDVVLSEGLFQQFMFESGVDNYEVLSWPSGKDIEFNFIKLFENSNLTETTKSKIKYVNGLLASEQGKFHPVIMQKSSAIPSKSILVNSDLVGESRQKELKDKIYHILKSQINTLKHM